MGWCPGREQSGGLNAFTDINHGLVRTTERVEDLAIALQGDCEIALGTKAVRRLGDTITIKRETFCESLFGGREIAPGEGHRPNSFKGRRQIQLAVKIINVVIEACPA